MTSQRGTSTSTTGSPTSGQDRQGEPKTVRDAYEAKATK